MGIFNFGRGVRRAAQEVGGPGMKQAQAEAIKRNQKAAEATREGAPTVPDSETTGGLGGEKYKGEAIEFDINAVQAQIDDAEKVKRAMQEEAAKAREEIARAQKEAKQLREEITGGGSFGHAEQIPVIKPETSGIDSKVA